SRPKPNGCAGVAGREARCIPYSSNNWLVVSTVEWTPSLIIAELPVIAAAMNLVIAIARLPQSAATTTSFDPCLLAIPLQLARRAGVEPHGLAQQAQGPLVAGPGDGGAAVRGDADLEVAHVRVG